MRSWILRRIFVGSILIGILLYHPLQAKAALSDSPLPEEQEIANTPTGWVQYCVDPPKDCVPAKEAVQTIELSETTWNFMVGINSFVNETIIPITDMEHWGVMEKWSIPTDGYGDCEDYALLKRKMLMEAGWPQAALLITVVRDTRNNGHAILTVVTDQGDYILDNLISTVMTTDAIPYHFLKRQSQLDPNVWVRLHDSRSRYLMAEAGGSNH